MSIGKKANFKSPDWFDEFIFSVRSLARFLPLPIISMYWQMLEIYMKETASLNNIFLFEASPMCFVFMLENKKKRKSRETNEIERLVSS